MNRLYIGTYTQDPHGPAAGHRAEGIFIYDFDPASGQLTRVGAAEAGPNPGFLALHPDGRFLYAGNELPESEASALAIEPAGGLTRLNHQPTHGADSCYISLDPSGRWVLVASYSSGTLTVLPVEADGCLGAPTDIVQHHLSVPGANPGRQDAAHAHSILFDPSGRFVLSADLGMDRVFVYRLDTEKGKLLEHPLGWVNTQPGAGPRHLAFNRGGTVAYVANELNGTVSAYTWDAQAGQLAPLQTLSTLPETYQGENTVADIHLAPSGDYLYVSNRGDNSIAVYRVDASDGRLTRTGIFSCGGNWPRNFAIDPSGRYLLVANQYSQDVIVLRIAADGALTPTGIEVSIPAPVCVLFE